MNRLKIISLIVLVIIILSLPLFLNEPYFLHLMILVGVYIMLSQALNLLIGYVGLVSFGNQAYLLVGGYASAYLALKLGLSFWITLPIAILVTALVGLGIGYVTLRLRGAYFVIVTIGFGEIARLLPLNINELGGPPGLRNIPTPTIQIGNLINYNFGTSKEPYYYLIWILAFLAILICTRLVHSRQGRAFMAMRENEPLARAVGINAFRHAMLAFIISVCITGAAGAVYAHYLTIVSPEIGAFSWTLGMLTMVVIGGQGTIVGPIIGAIIFTFLPEWLRVAKDLRLPIYGLILMLAVLFFPGGLRPVFGKWIEALLVRLNLVPLKTAPVPISSQGTDKDQNGNLAGGEEV